MQLRPLFPVLGPSVRYRSRAIRRVCAVALAGASIALTGAGGSPGATVTVDVTELRSTKGMLLACMTSDPERFPKCRGDARARALALPADHVTQLTFRHVAPGTYAIALLHDENSNGKADRALGLMPKEGFGFSRDAKVHMGPPRFDEAAFQVGSDPVNQTIRMRYML